MKYIYYFLIIILVSCAEDKVDNPESVDINLKNDKGFTPLMIEANRHNPDLEGIKLLIKRGSNINEIDKKGKSILFYAVKNKNLELISLLLEKGATPSTKAENEYYCSPIVQACVDGTKDIMNLLISKKADINSKCRFDYSCIHAFTENNSDDNIEYLKYLIENKVDINVSTTYGHTGLMFASFKGNYEIVKLLLEKGANVNAVNNKASSALSESEKSMISKSSEAQEKITQLLVSNGAIKFASASINLKERFLSEDYIYPILTSSKNEPEVSLILYYIKEKKIICDKELTEYNCINKKDSIEIQCRNNLFVNLSHLDIGNNIFVETSQVSCNNVDTKKSRIIQSTLKKYF